MTSLGSLAWNLPLGQTLRKQPDEPVLSWRNDVRQFSRPEDGKFSARREQGMEVLTLSVPESMRSGSSKGFSSNAKTTPVLSGSRLFENCWACFHWMVPPVQSSLLLEG